MNGVNTNRRHRGCQSRYGQNHDRESLHEEPRYEEKRVDDQKQNQRVFGEGEQP